MPHPQKWGTSAFQMQIWWDLAFPLNPPRSRCKKTEEVCAKFEAEKDFRVVTHKQGKSFFLWENMMRTLENRNRSSVSASPEHQCEPHLMMERRDQALKQFDYREVITFSPHFSPLFSLLSFLLYCTQRSNSEHDSSLRRYEYQSAGLEMRSCYCRNTACSNREGTCTSLKGETE